MIVAALLLGLQASADATPPVPEKFSILVSAEPPCQRAPGSLDKGDIVICAPADQQQRLPLRDERGPPEGPIASNPYLRPDVALNNAEPCAIHGCLVGFGPPIVPMVKGAVDLAKKAFAKKPDKSGRVSIDLNEPTPPDAESKILP